MNECDYIEHFSLIENREFVLINSTLSYIMPYSFYDLKLKIF